MNMARRTALKLPLIAAVSMVLSACTGLLPGNTPPSDLYRLTPKSSFSSDLPAVALQLVIEEPLAGGGLDSARIALRPSPTQLKYFYRTRWTERAPKMVQTLLVESFENSGKILAVSRQAIGLRSDFSLKTELREFQAEYFGDAGAPPTVHVRINAKLIEQPRQRIIAAGNFEHTVSASSGEIGAIVSAFDQALGKVAKRLVEWTLRAIPATPPAQG
jgi:cholesterol transport system auxiliary component